MNLDPVVLVLLEVEVRGRLEELFTPLGHAGADLLEVCVVDLNGTVVSRITMAS
jgi:hypothetical protein